MLKKLMASLILLGWGFATNMQFGNTRTLNLGQNRVQVLNSSISGLDLNVTTGKLVLQDVSIEGATYTRVALPGGGHTANVGLPELPTFPVKVAIPEGARIRVSYDAKDFTDIPDIELFPAQSPLPETPQGNEQVDFQINNEFYSSDTWYPVKLASHTPTYKIRGVNVTSIIIAPIQYNPYRKVLRIYRNLSVHVEFIGGGRVYDPRLMSPYFYSLFKNMLANSNLISPPLNEPKTNGADMIYFVPDSLYDSLRPLVEWRNLSGIKTRVVLLSELGNVSAQSIRDYILQAYNNWNPAPSFVGIVGDAELIPPDYRFHHPYTDELIGTDIYYAEMDSGSYIPFPDIFVGRISVDNSVQLGNYVRKLLKYEENPYTNVNWFNNILLAAYNESGRYFVATSESAYVYLNQHGYHVIRQYEDGNPPGSTDGVIEAINNGVAIVNHRDHGASRNGGGSLEGWGHPRFSVSNLSQLTNANMTPVFFSPNCESGWFDGETDEYPSRNYESIGEELIRLPNKGAIGYIGATRISYSGYNDELDKGFWDALFPDFHPGYPDSSSVNPYGMRIPWPGGILNNGKYYMYDRYVLTNGGSYPWQPDSQKTRTEFEEFNYVGDPATTIRTAMPQELTVDFPPTIPIGSSQITVTVTANGAPVEGANVVLVQDTSVYVHGVTNSAGQAILDIEVTTPDTVVIAVSGYNLTPFISGIQPISNGPYVTVYNTSVDDDTTGLSNGNGDGIINPGETVEIGFNFKNWGIDTAVGVTFHVYGDSIAEVLDTTSHTIGNVAPGDTVSGDTIPVAVANGIEDGRAFTLRIEAVSASGDTWNSYRSFIVGTPSMELDSYTINDSGATHFNHRLDPGENAYLRLSILNSGHGIAYSPFAILSTSDTFLTVSSETLRFENIYPDSSALSLDSIMISADPGTPKEHHATINVVVTTEDGYSDTMQFEVIIGQITSEDPMGPDNYGYYAYDITDRFYQEAPQFEWIEINSTGTRLSLGDDATSTVNLPAGFNFRYYGRIYNRLTVCSNGFIAAGNSSHSYYSNRSLPHNDGAIMIAPFWDDLNPRHNSSGNGYVYHYYDAQNHRFIVEYDSVAHYGSNTSREKFEVIFYDANYYPTPTGDSPILFQYLRVSNSNSCTIGIENPTESDALQYLYNGDYNRAAASLTDSFAIKFTTVTPLKINEQPPISIRTPVFSGIYPNLLRDKAEIRFALPQRAEISLRVYDVSGRVITHIADGVFEAGLHSLRWNGKSDTGAKLSSGIYFIQLRVGDSFSSVKKVMILR